MRTSEYAANSIGISGIKYVLGPDVSFFRRLIWLICIVMATAWMLWNIQGRVVYFLSRPSAITTEMKFKDKLMFPKITICNQNMFRSSRVFDESETPHKSPTLYEAVDRYLQVLPDDNKYQSLRQKVIDKYEKLLREKHVKEFYRKVSHQKTALIHSCTWKGQRCGPENFTEVFTNMGICYQFNLDTEFMTVDKANKDGGLEVTLFVEQYDYMRGPQTTAGALVLFTDHNETEALAKDQGIGVTVGHSVSIGLQQSDVMDLPMPYSSCGASELDIYPKDEPYTYQKCHLNCLTSFIKTKCGCVNIYMPGETAWYCSLLEILTCVQPAEKLFYRRNQINTCNCPSPCQSTNYVYSVSLVQFSDSFKQSLSLDDHSVSLATVNRAVAIQAWGLLNRMNTNITDDLAELGIIIDDLKVKWTELSYLADNFVNELILLEKFISENNLTDEVMMKTDLKAALNAIHRVKRAKDVCDGFVSLEHSFTFADDYKMAGSILSNIGSYEWIVSISSKIDSTIEIFFGYDDIICKFRQAVIGLIHSEDIIQITTNGSEESPNVFILRENVTEDLHNTMSEMTAFITKCKQKANALEKRYLLEMTSLTRIGKKTYDELPPEFYNENILKLEIYFKNLGVLESKKSPAYSPEGLVCDIGGSIGLCLGGSILTLVEIFDILTILFGTFKTDVTDLKSSEMENVQ